VNIKEVARLAAEFVRAYENALAAEHSANVFPKDVLIEEMRRREAVARQKYAELRAAVIERVERA
jgi:hypothetical protein